MNRRMFLRGAGGSALGIPCLTSLLPRPARAAYSPPKRFVALSADHGFYEQLWSPASYKRKLPDGQTHTERELAAIDGPVSNIIGAPFERPKSKLLLIRGLDSALHFPNSNGHMRSTTLCGTLLNKGPVTPPIDVVLARSPKVRLPGTPIAQVSCGVWGENHSYYVDKGAMKSSYMYGDSRRLFQYLFGSFAASSTAEGELLLRRKKPLVDSVLDGYRSLMGSPKLGADDRRVLDEFVGGFAAVEKRLRDFGGAPGCQVPTHDPAPCDRKDTAQYDRRMKEMLDVLALALKCGVVQVAQCGFPTPEISSPPPESNYAIFKHLSVPGAEFTLPCHSYSHEDGDARQTNPIFQRWLAPSPRTS